MITNGGDRLNRRHRRRDLCYNISKLNPSSKERRCLAHEGETLHNFYHGRDSGHDLGRCGLGCHDRTGSTALAVQRNPIALILGQPDRYDYGFYRNHIRCVHGDNECVASAPPRRPLTPAREETARRQKSYLTAAYSVGRFLSDARWGGSRNISFCLSRLGGHFPF